MVKSKATEMRTRKLAPVENDDSVSLGNISNMSSYLSYHRETLKQSQTPKPKEKPKAPSRRAKKPKAKKQILDSADWSAPVAEIRQVQKRASRKAKTFAKVAMKESPFQKESFIDEQNRLFDVVERTQLQPQAAKCPTPYLPGN